MRNIGRILSMVVLVAMLLTAGCVAHGEFTTGAAESGNEAAANINAGVPSGDHSTADDIAKVKETTDRPARDD